MATAVQYYSFITCDGKDVRVHRIRIIKTAVQTDVKQTTKS